MEHLLEMKMELPLPRAEVFAFFSAAGNLQKITPPELGFTTVTPPDVVIEKDMLLEYRLRIFWFPIVWVSKISVWEPPVRFVDEQVRGPYKQWIHQHTFEDAHGGTIIRDHVRYRLPFEPLGDAAYPLVRRQLRRIFAYRDRAIREALLSSRAG